MSNMVLLTFNTNHKINAIKALRAFGGMGLKEAKDCIEQGTYMYLSEVPAFIAKMTTEMVKIMKQRHDGGFGDGVDGYFYIDANHYEAPPPAPVRYTWTF